MEKREKRKLSALFSDKRLLVALSGLLLGTALLVHQLNPRPTPEAAAPGGLNAGLPPARDETPKSKLELQAEGDQPDRVAMPGRSGIVSPDSGRLQAEVPGSVVPYLYGARASSAPSASASPEPVPGTSWSSNQRVRRPPKNAFGCWPCSKSTNATKKPAVGSSRPT